MFIYKICQYDLWIDYQPKQIVPLAKEDNAFIHFATEEQVEKVLNKFFVGQKTAILKIDSTKLVGDLKFESNHPNHDNASRYYHLYNGHIPWDSIVSHEIRTP